MQSFFFKKRVQRDDDRVWITTDLKWNGIVDDVLKERADNVFILVVAHFKKTSAELQWSYSRVPTPQAERVVASVSRFFKSSGMALLAVSRITLGISPKTW